MGGGAGIQGSVNIGGNLSVALASQLSFVIASNSIVGSSITSNSTIQSAGTATVNALVSNVYGLFGQNVTFIFQWQQVYQIIAPNSTYIIKIKNKKYDISRLPGI
jgi:hypothetical protein